MSKTKKILIGLLPALAIAGVVYAAPYTLQDLFVRLGLIQKQVDALQTQIEEPQLKGIARISDCFLNNAASTTPTMIISAVNATTTSAVCDIGGAKNLSLLLRVGASTTGRLVKWEYEFSHNQGAWFVENVSALGTAGTVARTHGNGTTTHQMTVNATTSVALTIDNPLARYMRINFSADLATVNFWGVVTRQEDQN